MAKAPRQYEEPTASYNIKQIRLNENTVVRVVLKEYAERETIDIRQWYKTKADPTVKPGKGMVIPLEYAKDVRDALNLAIARAEKEGLDV
jgi:hypothetical protein